MAENKKYAPTLDGWKRIKQNIDKLIDGKVDAIKKIVGKGIVAEDISFSADFSDSFAIGTDLTKEVKRLVPMQNVTWAELKELRDSSRLVPGKQYRITDYHCTTTQTDTQAADNQFDIIVTADEVNVLNENARACKHDFTEEMKQFYQPNDDWYVDGGDHCVWTGELWDVTDGNDRKEKCWFFKCYDGYEFAGYFVTKDYSKSLWIIKGDEGTSFDETSKIAIKNDQEFDVHSEWGISDYCFPSTPNEAYFSDSKLESWEIKYCLDNDTDRFLWADSNNGHGVIYFMKDEWNNECSYDFKNIQFKRCISQNSEDETWYVDETNGSNKYLYTFAAYEVDSSSWKDATLCNGLAPDDGCCSCENNVIKPYQYDYDYAENSCLYRLNNIVFINNYNIASYSYFVCSSNTFGYGCSSNTFGYGFSHNTFGNYCSYNTFGSYCYSNTFGNYCYSNTFGNGFSYNTFGNYCYSNTFGIGCYSNTFGSYCYSNTFGNYCYSNTFGSYCYSNTFGNYCYSNTFGIGCTSNTFGDGFSHNTFGSYCYSNTFGIGCYSNTFGSYCYSNTFGNYCYSNTFGNRCYRNTFGTSSSTRSYFRHIKFENGVSYTYLNCVETTSNSKFAQNVHVNSGVCGASNTNRKTLTIYTAGNNFLTTFGSEGDMKINV